MDEKIHPQAEKMHYPVMLQTVNIPQFPVKKYTPPVIGSSDSKNRWSSNDQDIAKEKAERISWSERS